jgi:HPt (histidine-containing phosphotransfer) domain-containing protein
MLFGARASAPTKAIEGGGAETAAQTAALPRIEGVDLEDACNRLGLPLETLLSMLARFPAGARRTLGELREALEEADAEAARRHAHSLAGAAGNLSIETLRRLAKTLELALKSQTGNYETLYGELAVEADRVFAALDRLPGLDAPSSRAKGEPDPVESPVPGVKMEPGQLKVLLEELAAQLDAGDPDASASLLAELKAGALLESWAAEFTRIEALAAEFRFPEAAKIARELTSALS